MMLSPPRSPHYSPLFRFSPHGLLGPKAEMSKAERTPFGLDTLCMAWNGIELLDRCVQIETANLSHLGGQLRIASIPRMRCVTSDEEARAKVGEFRFELRRLACGKESDEARPSEESRERLRDLLAERTSWPECSSCISLLDLHTHIFLSKTRACASSAPSLASSCHTLCQNLLGRDYEASVAVQRRSTADPTVWGAEASRRRWPMRRMDARWHRLHLTLIAPSKWPASKQSQVESDVPPLLSLRNMRVRFDFRGASERA